jgi:hypothetical protein
MRRSFLLGLFLFGFFLTSSHAKDQGPATPAQLEALRGYIDGTKRVVLPGFSVSASDCVGNVQNANFDGGFTNTLTLSRLVYALSQGAAANDPRLNVAYGMQNILVQSMLRKTEQGDVYFVPDMPGPGQAVKAVLSPNEMAYAVAGLLAFHRATKNPSALKISKDIWKTLRKRFRNPNPAGGLVNGWNPTTQARTEIVDHGSIIYTWMASGWDMLDSLNVRDDGPDLRDQERLLRETVKIAVAMLRNDALTFESLNARTLEPAGDGQHIVILGHYAQLLLFLEKAYARGVVVDGIQLKPLLQQQFRTLLRPQYVNRVIGGIRNGFIQETGQAVQPWGTNMALWQICELLAALDHGLKLNIFDRNTSREAADIFRESFTVLGRFFDSSATPIGAVMNEEGVIIDEDRAQIPHILGYHLPDLLRYLLD